MARDADQPVCIRLFARGRDLVGADRLTLHLPAGATLGDMRRRLAEDYPGLAALLKRSALAINDEFASDELLVPVDGEVAVLPPVSGG